MLLHRKPQICKERVAQGIQFFRQWAVCTPPALVPGKACGSGPAESVNNVLRDLYLHSLSENEINTGCQRCVRNTPEMMKISSGRSIIRRMACPGTHSGSGFYPGNLRPTPWRESWSAQLFGLQGKQ